jgi:PPOX class probable F420-dependent enzyme
MTSAEIDDYLSAPRTVTMATVGSDELIHQVAMFYAWLDGEMWIETKTKSQKVQNLRRDDRMSMHVEDGTDYHELRGVNLRGRGDIVDDADQLWRVGMNLVDRYHGGYDESKRPFLEGILNNRVAVRMVPTKVTSWDHRKLPADVR